MFGEKFKAYLKAARLEYGIAEAPGAIIPLFLAIIYTGHIELLRTVEAVTAFLLLFLSGFLVNSLTDLEVDEKYKNYVAEGVKSLGRRSLIAILLAHLLVALLLTVHLSYQLSSTYPLLFYAVGVFFGLGYSLEPFHFKVRGVLHPIALSIAAFFIPFLFLVYTITGEFSLSLLPLAVGFTFLHYGIALTNQAQDLLEDRDAGMLTPAVRWGLGRTLKLALLLFGIGFAVLLSGMYMLILTLNLDVGVEISLLIVTSLILLSGYLVPLRGIGDLYRYSLKATPLEEKLLQIKKRLSYPRWQASGLYSLLLTVMLLAVATALFPQEGSYYTPQTSSLPQNVEETGGGIQAAVLGEVYQDSNGTYIQPIAVRMILKSSEKNYFILAVSRSGGETFATIFEKVQGEETTLYLPVERPQISDINITLLKDIRPVAYFTIPAMKTIYITSPEVSQENLTLPNRAEYTLNLKVFNGGDDVVDKGALVVKAIFVENSIPSELKVVMNNATLQPQESWEVSLDHQGSRGSTLQVDVELYYSGILVDEITLP